MKPGIHPDYHPVVFQDSSTGDAFLTRSTVTSSRTIEWSDGQTYPLITVDISAASHPFWSGRIRVLDEAGQVEKFRRHYGTRRLWPSPSAAPRAATPATAAPNGRHSRRTWCRSSSTTAVTSCPDASRAYQHSLLPPPI